MCDPTHSTCGPGVGSAQQDISIFAASGARWAFGRDVLCFRYDGLAFLVDEELIPWSPNRYLMSRQLTWAEARQPVQRKDASGDAIKLAYCDYYYAPTQPRGGLEADPIRSYLIRSDYIRSERAAATCSNRANHPSAAMPCSTAAVPHMRRR